MSCDVGKATEGLENELWRRWSDGKVGALLILQPFRHFTYVTTHSPTLPLLYLHHSSFSNPSIASPMSQFTLNSSFASSTSKALHLIDLASHLWLFAQNDRKRLKIAIAQFFMAGVVAHSFTRLLNSLPKETNIIVPLESLHSKGLENNKINIVIN